MKCCCFAWMIFDIGILDCMYACVRGFLLLLRCDDANKYFDAIDMRLSTSTTKIDDCCQNDSHYSQQKMNWAKVVLLSHHVWCILNLSLCFASSFSSLPTSTVYKKRNGWIDESKNRGWQTIDKQNKDDEWFTWQPVA